jgi:hypothetical protein
MRGLTSQCGVGRGAANGLLGLYRQKSADRTNIVTWVYPAAGQVVDTRLGDPNPSISEAARSGADDARTAAPGQGPDLGGEPGGPLKVRLWRRGGCSLTPGRAGKPTGGHRRCSSRPVIDAGKEPFCACRLVVPPGANPTGRPTLDGGA